MGAFLSENFLAKQCQLSVVLLYLSLEKEASSYPGKKEIYCSVLTWL